MTQTLISSFEDLEIFADLSAEDLSIVRDKAVLRRLKRGEVLIRQGEGADRVYYVLRGKFDVLRDGSHLVAEITAGEPIGEIAFFAGLPRTADVIASRDSEVLELTRDEYNDLAARMPAFTESILRTLGRRLAAATASVPMLQPKAPDVIGLCAAGDTPIPRKLIDDLARAFIDVGGKLNVVSACDLPAGLDLSNEDALSDWLSHLEQDEGRLLLVTGEGNEAWDQAALRQCDQILLVARASSPPDVLSALERYAMPLFRPRQTKLVLWRHSASEPITGTAAWLALRNVHLHHHVALDRASDMARIVRFLTGRALGAVFSGGGALGTGHIGALRALNAAGIQFDIAGGTSIGASVAIAVARMDDPAKMMQDFEWFFTKRRSFSKVNLPLYSVFDHNHLDRGLRVLQGDQRIEDLPLCCYTVAANLTNNEPFIHRTGYCWQVMRTSASIPGALPPFITDDGDILVDGGVMDNIPIGVIRGLKSGPNMIFMLWPGSDWRVKARYHGLPSRWRLAWQLMTRRHQRGDFPTVAEIVARAMTVTSGRSFRGAGLGRDLLLEPPTVPGMGLMTWKLGRVQEEAGYEYTMRLIDSLGGPEALLRWQAEA